MDWIIFSCFLRSSTFAELLLSTGIIGILVKWSIHYISEIGSTYARLKCISIVCLCMIMVKQLFFSIIILKYHSPQTINYLRSAHDKSFHLYLRMKLTVGSIDKWTGSSNVDWQRRRKSAKGYSKQTNQQLKNHNLKWKLIEIENNMVALGLNIFRPSWISVLCRA